MKKLFFILIVFSGIAAVSLFLLFETASAEEAVKPHPAFGKGQLSRTLFKEDRGGTRRPAGPFGRNVAIAKLNQIAFKGTMQDLTAREVFRAKQPVLDVPNPNRFSHRNRTVAQ